MSHPQKNFCYPSRLGQIPLLTCSHCIITFPSQQLPTTLQTIGFMSLQLERNTTFWGTPSVLAPQYIFSTCSYLINVCWKTEQKDEDPGPFQKRRLAKKTLMSKWCPWRQKVGYSSIKSQSQPVSNSVKMRDLVGPAGSCDPGQNLAQ